MCRIMLSIFLINQHFSRLNFAKTKSCLTNKNLQHLLIINLQFPRTQRTLITLFYSLVSNSSFQHQSPKIFLQGFSNLCYILFKSYTILQLPKFK